MSNTLYSRPAALWRTAITGASALTLLALPAIAQLDAVQARAESAPIISVDRERDGEAMNYAVVLTEGSSAEQLKTLADYVDAQGNKSLVRYPHLSVFFAQSAKKSFASSLAEYAAQQGITLHSVGPTRTNIITDSELVVEANTPAPPAATETPGGGSAADGDEWVPDPYTKKNNWGLYAIGAIEAQHVDVPRADVVVGVIDSGVDGNHPDLAGQIIEDKSVSCGHNGIPDTSREQWQDVDSHGTHVAGTIAAAHNGVGLDSVAPQVKIAAVRASDEEGYFYPEYVTCAFNWAVDKGFDITNNSYYVDPWEFWVPTEPSQAAGYESVRRAVAYAHHSGVLNVGAAGNSNYDIAHPTTDDNSPNDVEGAKIEGRDVTGGYDIPTMLPEMVRVSAVGQTDRNADPATTPLARARFSNYGVGIITVAAPGVDIASTVPVNGDKPPYGYKSGTSMASPHVAGVAGLLKSIHPEATPNQLTELLKKHAQANYNRLAPDAAGKDYRGVGLVDALAAVLKDQPKPVVSALEYSADAKVWIPLENSINIATYPSVYVRVSATGPVTALNLVVGENNAANARSDNPFGTDLSVSTQAINLGELYAQGITSVPVALIANGRNNDSRADDDVVESLVIDLVSEPVPPAETPQSTPEEPTSDTETPAVPATDTPTSDNTSGTPGGSNPDASTPDGSAPEASNPNTDNGNGTTPAAGNDSEPTTPVVVPPSQPVDALPTTPKNNTPVKTHLETATVVTNVKTVVAGKTITFTAQGFTPGEKVSFTVHSEPVHAGTVLADNAGRATLEWEVPANFELGEHRVMASNGSGKSAEYRFTVVGETHNTSHATSAPNAAAQSQKTAATAKTLAATGAYTMTMLSMAGVALAAGATVVAAKRRRD